MKRYRYWLSAAILLLLIVGGLGSYIHHCLYQPVKLKEPASVIIMPRATFNYVAGKLQQRGLIPNALVFKLYARLSGKAGKLHAGEYDVTNGQTPLDIMKMLASGRVKAYWVTVPEGKWSSEVAQLLANRMPGNTDFATEFAAEAGDMAYWRTRAKFPLEGKSLEGYLFPDTYLFAKGVNARQVIENMLDAFQKKCYRAYRQEPPADGRSLYQVLTLASLVEAEAKKPEERPIIAGVYMNRLRLGMKLQCDATVLYAHQQRLKRVWDKDTTLDSPYNTYQYAGLPAGPICNPGLASFEAALHPVTVDYLFYVARGDGTHIFSRTSAEHEAAVKLVHGK